MVGMNLEQTETRSRPRVRPEMVESAARGVQVMEPDMKWLAGLLTGTDPCWMDGWIVRVA
ncbi:unnamed protein product [Staurois parvus]|uniref:Transposase n=1 Tax=Staurois parvus TaxID=386267 RepID=A0ABN9CT89_9NEOB|nr:unnamed protein product [Staurois parvus]